jgi:hypothetical protein
VEKLLMSILRKYIDNHRRDAFGARSKDPFSKPILRGTSDKDIRLTNLEFHELTAAIFVLSSPICKQHLGAQIKKANQNKTVDLHGERLGKKSPILGSTFVERRLETKNM